MSKLLEQLVGAKALIEGAIAEEIARTDPAPPPVAEPEASVACDHKNRHDVTGAGGERKRMACVDCGHTWEVE